VMQSDKMMDLLAHLGNPTRRRSPAKMARAHRARRRTSTKASSQADRFPCSELT